MDEVNTYWQAIASANWLASATFVAKHVTHGVLIDMGSTSTDFILISNHELICQGFTDATRMQTEELVYTGLIRTPLMAITQKITFQNTETSIAAEYFSTTADVYRLTGDLSEKHDMANTADGKEKSQLASARRIARMIGRDVDDAPMHDWQELAQSFKKLQISRLREVAKKQLARLHSAENISIIGAGAGHRVVREMALDMGLTYKAASDLVHHAHLESDAKDWINVCLPAYAVARLALLQNAQ